MPAGNFLAMALLSALLLPAIPVLARESYRCGRRGTGKYFAWIESWSRLCRIILPFGYLFVLVIGIMALTLGAGASWSLSNPTLVLLAPCLLCVAYLPLAAMVMPFGYNFGAQRRARDELVRRSQSSS